MVDIKQFMDNLHEIKLESEVENLKVASKFVKWSFKELVEKVEDIIENEKKTPHSKIQN